MTTKAPAQLVELQNGWKALFKSAKPSGIVGDTAHAKRGGYHISREDQTNSSNYSVLRPDDKGGPDDLASAVDMSLNTADMIECTKRLLKVYNNKQDPRRKYLNGFNGTTDGKTARRWDFYATRTGTASADHLWHIHLSVRRRYCNSATAVKAILSALKGESVSTYMSSIGVVKAVAPAAPKPAPVAPVKAPSYPGHELHRNDHATKPDAAVKAFQVQMLKRGWSSLGKADGFFGPKMESVVIRWQKTCKLQADGLIGPKTWPTPWTRKLGA